MRRNSTPSIDCVVWARIPDRISVNAGAVTRAVLEQAPALLYYWPLNSTVAVR